MKLNMKNITREASILHINAEGNARQSLSLVLEKGRYLIREADSVEAALEVLAANHIDVVLINHSTNQRLDMGVIRRIKRSFLYTEVVVLYRSDDGHFAHQAMQAGAFDCLSEPFSPEQLFFKLSKAVEYSRMKRELIALRREVALTCGFDNLVGISKTIVKLKETAGRIAPTDIPVLIAGASGTGKGLLARVIHHHSNRRSNPFVTVDCSNIDEDLLEMELFGPAESSLIADQPTSQTSLERADSGTVFLDMIDRMPLSVQSKLAHIWEGFQIKRSNSMAERKLDLRIIAASDKDLGILVAEGKFREDLFQRLSVVKLHVPPLTERAEDIEILASYFLRTIAAEFGERQFTISRQAIDKLAGYRWPGNVRELENTLRRAVAVTRGSHLESDDITFITSDLRRETGDRMPTLSVPRQSDGLLDENQRSVIMKALIDNKWNFTQTAQELGIGRTTLWRKVKKYNLKREPESKQHSCD